MRNETKNSKWDDETSGTMQGGTPLLISLIS